MFFVDERVSLVKNNKERPEVIETPILGRITSVIGEGGRYVYYNIKGDDGKEYQLEASNWGRVDLREAQKCMRRFGQGYELKRLNPEELGKKFEETLTGELGLIKKLAEHQDETNRVATLTTIRNLTRYLSAEIEAAYKEAEQLAKESDETGKAAALTTLRNLNAYLTERAEKQAP